MPPSSSECAGSSSVQESRHPLAQPQRRFCCFASSCMLELALASCQRFGQSLVFTGGWTACVCTCVWSIPLAGAPGVLCGPWLAVRLCGGGILQQHQHRGPRQHKPCSSGGSGSGGHVGGSDGVGPDAGCRRRVQVSAAAVPAQSLGLWVSSGLNYSQKGVYLLSCVKLCCAALRRAVLCCAVHICCGGRLVAVSG